MYGYGNYPQQNPYQQRLNMMEMGQLPRYEIIRVNGENGARALQMAPNSNVLLLDETADLVWLAQTDGAGYKTVTPYSIAPYQPTTQVSVSDLEERIARLEARLNEQNPAATGAKRTGKSGGSADE